MQCNCRKPRLISYVITRNLYIIYLVNEKTIVWNLSIDVPDFFFRGGGQADPLEFRNFFSRGGLGGPGGKQGVNRI